MNTQTTDDQKVIQDGRTEFINFLNKHGIKAELINPDQYGWSRVIGFTVYGIEYRIVWYVNESTLRVGTHERAAQIPFKYMYFDNTFPLVGGNRSIGFAYVKLNPKSIWERDYQYEVFRLPIEL